MDRALEWKGGENKGKNQMERGMKRGKQGAWGWGKGGWGKGGCERGPGARERA